MVWSWHPLSDLPEVYDVIRCRFPYRPHLHVPADPPHYVVVREIERYDPLGEAIVHVTYGTSKVKQWRELVDLIIDKPSEMAAAGLNVPTRFDLQDDLNKLPCFWCREFFPDGKRTGKLTTDGIRKLENRLRWRRLGT
jgi:hypothetical protein